MRLLRFISEEELKALLATEDITHEDEQWGSTSLKNSGLVLFLNLDKAEEYISRYSYISTDPIELYNFLLLGIVDTEYAVVIEKDESEVTIGQGVYADPMYYNQDDENSEMYINDDIEIDEVGVYSYSLDDVTELYKNDGTDTFLRLR